MAFYYVTAKYEIYKSVGARKVKLIDRSSFRDLFADEMIKTISQELTNEIDAQIINSLRCFTGKPIYDGGIIYAPYIPLITTKAPKLYKEKNRIPIQIFRAQHKIICETNDFNVALFELAMKNL